MVTWRYAAIGALMETSGDYDWSGETHSEWQGYVEWRDTQRMARSTSGFNSFALQIPDNTFSGNGHSVSGDSHSPHWRREALILRLLESRLMGERRFGVL